VIPRHDPDGLPSLAQFDVAGAAGAHHDGGPARGPGSRAFMSITLRAIDRPA